MKKVLCAVFSLAATIALAVDFPEPVGGVITIDIDTDVEYTTVLGSGVTKIVKKGAGKATLAASNAAFEGEIAIEEGTLAGCVKNTTKGTGTTYTQSFGRGSQITVEDGATLLLLDHGGENDVYADMDARNKPFYPGKLVLAGSGVGGKGAVVTTAPASMHNVFADVTFTGDVTIDATARWGWDTKWDMGGYSLTIVCGGGSNASGFFEISRQRVTTMSNVGDVYVESGAAILFEAVNGLTMPSGWKTGDKTAYLNGGAVRNFNTSTVFPWKIVVSKAATSELVGYMSDFNYAYDEKPTQWQFAERCRFSAPVELAGADTTLNLSFYNDGMGNMLNFFGPVRGPGKLQVMTSGNNRGHVFFRAKDNVLGEMNVNRCANVRIMEGAALSVTNATSVDQWGNPTWSPINVASNWSGSNKTARLIVDKGGLLTAPYVTPVKNTAPTLAIADASGTYGILDIRDGGTVTNSLWVGEGGQGAIHMRGGEFFAQTAAGQFVGAGNYGAMIMDGGKVVTTTALQLGKGGTGIFVQRGGTVTIAPGGKDNFDMLSLARSGASSYGVYWNAGGFLDVSGHQVWFNKDNSTTTGEGAYSIFAVDGPTARTRVDLIRGAVCTQSKLGVIALLNGGTLECGRICRDTFNNVASGNDKWADALTRTLTSQLVLSFDGGILKTRQDGELFSYGGEADAQRAPERVLVYEKGAVVDTDGHDVVFRAPLSAPQGKGLAGFTVEDWQKAPWYAVGPRPIRAYTQNSGGKLLNVAAVMDYNITNLTQQGAKILYPGENLPETTAVQCRYDTMSGYWTGGVQLRMLASGDFVKRGAGKLSLVGANTYGGKTRIEGGAIEFLNEEGMTGNDIEFAAEAVEAAELGAPLLMANRLKLNAGKKLRVTGVDGLTVASFGKMRTLVSVANAMSAMPDVELVDSEGQVVTSADWRFSFSADRKTLKFGKASGIVVVVQ